MFNWIGQDDAGVFLAILPAQGSIGRPNFEFTPIIAFSEAVYLPACQFFWAPSSFQDGVESARN
jgi:hypothetical protein